MAITVITINPIIIFTSPTPFLNDYEYLLHTHFIPLQGFPSFTLTPYAHWFRFISYELEILFLTAAPKKPAAMMITANVPNSTFFIGPLPFFPL